jgi:branched-chain amino acid aminotransferase
MEARSKGYDEAVFLNIEGNVAEGPGENIFIVKDGVLKTNDGSESVLEGITRETILELAKDFGIKASIGPITKEDFFQADEAFFTGTAVEIAPIVIVADDSDPKIQKKEYTLGIGKKGEITSKLATAYKETVCGKVKKHEKWLTFVNE